MSGFILSPDAVEDLHRIWDYIAKDNIDAADRVVDELESVIQRLADMPGMGHIREDLSDEALRVWPVRSYLVIYRAGASPLEIVRIVSGYRNVASLFG